MGFFNGQKIWMDIFIKRKYTWPHKKILNTSNLQRNANQIHSELWPRTCLNALTKCSTTGKGCPAYGEKGTLAHRWWECNLVQPLWKRVLRVLKVKNRTTVWSNNPTPGCAAQENKNAILKRYMHPNVHKYFVYKSQDMEATYISINRVNNKWCIYTMEYHFAVKKSCHLQQYGQTCRVLWLEKCQTQTNTICYHLYVKPKRKKKQME